MNRFPLSPFLAFLDADGIHLSIDDYARIQLALQTGGDWTIARLRDTLLVLLTRDPDQQELFLRRFDSFFESSLEIDKAVGALDHQQVLTDLQQLQTRRSPVEQTLYSVPQSFRVILPKLPEPPQFKFNFWTLWYALLIFGVAITSYLFWRYIDVPIQEPIVTEQTQPVSTPGKRIYDNVPVAKVSYEPLQTLEIWQRYAGISAFFFFATLLYGLYLWRSHKIPEDPVPKFNPDGPSYFPVGIIGGKPSPLLNDEILNELADSMGYFQSNESGYRLNLSRSIQSTMYKGGVPALEFYRRQQIRSLLILEDAFAETLVWNHCAQELATGITRYGVPVLYGQFHGSPEQFKTADGSVHRLEDIEDQRNGYLLLIFTDGKSMHQGNSAFALESLARWPMVAWMELREPRAWDESTILPIHYGIPLYPATPTGTLDAIRNFLTEQGEDLHYSDKREYSLQNASLAGAKLDAYIEQLLGDALLWAQDCAMLQPISPGLADALRRRFYKHLPADRIQRLYALPDTQYNVAGLRFSTEVLRILRTGFMIRHDEAEQETVLKFLIQEIEKTEPSEKDSLAHLAWESVKERVRLEIDQDQALARLAQLAKTPLASAINVSLNGFGFYDAGVPINNQSIPLRLKPTNPTAWQRLARISDSFNIPKLDAYPIAWIHRVLFSILALLFIGNCGLSIFMYLYPPLRQNWRVANANDTFAILMAKPKSSDSWQAEQSGTLEGLTAHALQTDKEYQLILYGGGYKSTQPIRFSDHEMTVVTISPEGVDADCHEEFPHIGLTIERCSEYWEATDEPIRQKTWRQRFDRDILPARLSSVGIEVIIRDTDMPEFRNFRNILLASNSVDVIYRIHTDNENLVSVFDAIQYIQKDLGPIIEHIQLVYWSNAQIHNPKIIDDWLSNFDRIIKLEGRDDYSEMSNFVQLLNQKTGRTIKEQEVVNVIRVDSDAQILLHSLSPNTIIAQDTDVQSYLQTAIPGSNTPITVRIIEPITGTIISRRAPQFDTPIRQLTPRELEVQAVIESHPSQTIRSLDYTIVQEGAVLTTAKMLNDFDQPYVINISDLSTGAYSIRAHVNDSNGNVFYSELVNFAIRAFYPPAPTITALGVTTLTTTPKLPTNTNSSKCLIMLSEISLVYHSDIDEFSGSVMIGNDYFCVAAMVILIAGEDGLLVSEQIYRVSGDQVNFQLDGSALKVEQKYIITAIPLNDANEIFTTEYEQIQVKKEFFYTPKVPDPLAVEIIAVAPNHEQGTLIIDLDISDETRVVSYEGFITDMDSGGAVHILEASLYRSLSIEEPLAANNPIRTSKEPHEYRLTLCVNTKDDAQVCADPYEFKPAPPPDTGIINTVGLIFSSEITTTIFLVLLGIVLGITGPSAWKAISQKRKSNTK